MHNMVKYLQLFGCGLLYLIYICTRDLGSDLRLNIYILAGERNIRVADSSKTLIRLILVRLTLHFIMDVASVGIPSLSMLAS